MSELWTALIEPQIYTNITTNFSGDVKAEYPKLSFTTQEEDISQANLPKVYIHLLPMSEMSNDLNNINVNAVRASVEVQVYVNTSKYDANVIANEVLVILKGMGFSIEQFPLTIQQGTIIRSVLRANRIMCSGDTI